MSFELQSGDPQAIPARVYHPGIGCTFMGVSGQALDVRNNAVEGMVVQLGGTLEGRAVRNANHADRVGVIQRRAL